MFSGCCRYFCSGCAFLVVTIKTLAGPLKLRRLRVLVVHAEMAESLIGDDLLAALGLDHHSVQTTKMSTGVISPGIDASGVPENSDSRRSFLVLKDKYSESEKGTRGEDILVGS
jgi:hypothetical protein